MSSFTGFSQEFCQNYRIFFSAIKKHQTGNSVILRAVLICCFQSPLCNTLKNTAWRQALIDVVVVVVVFVGHLIVADSLAALYLQTFAPVLLSVVVSSFFYCCNSSDLNLNSCHRNSAALCTFFTRNTVVADWFSCVLLVFDNSSSNRALVSLNVSVLFFVLFLLPFWLVDCSM